MGTATEEDIDGWLNKIGFDSLQKTNAGNWNFVQQSKDSAIQVNIMYAEADPESPPMIGVGCLFLESPQKNQLELYKRLLELHSLSQETKFCLVSEGTIMLITHRSAVDLDPSELKEMINNVVSMYDKFHNDCLSIVT